MRRLHGALAAPAALALLFGLAAPAWAVAPSAVANAQGVSAASPQTLSALGTATCAPGQVAVAAVELTGGAGASTFSLADSSDSFADSWTKLPINAASTFHSRIFKKVVTSAFTSATTFQITYSSTGIPFLVVSCFTDGTAVTNVANDLNTATSGSTGTTFMSATPAGPVSGASYQWAAVGLSNNISTTTLDAATTGGWVRDQISAGTGAGLVTYYRTAGGSTAATTLKVDFTIALDVAGWQEVQASAPAITTNNSVCLLLGVC